DASGLGALFLQLVPDLLNLELGQAIELRLQDGVGLDLVQIERLHQLAGGVLFSVRLPDELDGPIEPVEDLLESLEDVDPLPELSQLVLQSPSDGGEPKIDEMLEDLLEIQASGGADLGVAGRHQHGQV